MRDERRYYIDGSWTGPIEGRDHPVIDPSTEEPFATISLGGAADADAAVSAAKRAFPAWAGTSRDDRIAALERLKAAYDARIDEMAKVISLEMGAPIALAKAAQAVADESGGAEGRAGAGGRMHRGPKAVRGRSDVLASFR